MFTIIPVDVEGEEVMSLAKRFYLVMIVGAVLGLLSGLAFYGLTEVFSTFIVAVLVVFGLMALNRFLHLDGLSDMGDGMLVLGDQERKRQVMKDSHIGAGGLAYAMLFVLLSVACYSHLWHAWFFLVPFTVEILVKLAMVTCAAVGDSHEGLGGMFVQNTNAGSVVGAVVIATTILTGAWIFLRPDYMEVWESLLIMIALMVAAILTGVAVANRAMKHFGSVNGDILGATNEVARPMVLLAFFVMIWLIAQLP